MTLIGDIKTSLRVTSEAYDSEVRDLVYAARFDMERVGVDPTLLALNPHTQDVDNPFVKQAIRCYAKAHFGYDNPEAERFDDSYRRIVCDLMNSSHNIAAIANEPEAEPAPNGEAEGEGE